VAWINGRWVERNEREEIINATKQVVTAMSKNYHFLTPSELEELDSYISELERLERIHRSEVDLLYFSWEYFSELKNPFNIGNWDGFDIETVKDAPNFHNEICSLIDNVSNKKKNAKISVAAPRSHAKSSYLSKANPLREMVFRKRKFIVLFSETPTVAMGNLDWLSWQLKANKKLRDDYGELLSPKQQINPKDNTSEFITWEDKGENEPKKLLTYVKSVSTNQAIRGLNWNGTRPDYLVLDDIEGIHTNAGTPEQRAKLKDWFSSDVMPLGDAKGEKTAFIYMGTIVHQDSLLNNVINDNPEFKSVKYKAIINQPERQDLWEQCRSIYLDKNLNKDDRKEKAFSFYIDNKEEMDIGCSVLWKDAQPIFKLYTWKWSNGSKAFNTEYQNEPRDEESQIFVSEKFSEFILTELEDQPLDYYSFWDVASGKNLKRTDYNAIVTIAKNRRTGFLYVVHAWASKCKMHEALKEAVDIIETFSPVTFGVEDIGIGHDMPKQLKEKLAQKNIYSTRIKAVSSHSKKKDDRIASLEPLVESGFLRFLKDKFSLLYEQMEQFPGGTNDDLPDALASVTELAGGIGKQNRTYRKKPKGW
jgi:predicted phage terminase large subunit-like protein